MIEQGRCRPTFHLRTEVDSVSETLVSLEYQIMDKVRKPSNPEDSFVSVCHASVNVDNTLIMIFKSLMLHRRDGLRLTFLRVVLGKFP